MIELDTRYADEGPAEGDSPEMVGLHAVRAALGYRRVQLETGLRQPKAIALYATAGYHPIPTYGRYEGDVLSVCFAKDLVSG
jgi:hypothetical protein